MKISLENVLDYEQPTKYIVETENYSDSFSMPVLTAGKSFILGYTDEKSGICKASISPVIIFDDFTTESKYVSFDFKVKSSAMKILHKKNEEDNLKYFFYAMQNIKYKPFSHKRAWISEYSKFVIAKRTPEEQTKIANDLDFINEAITIANSKLFALNELVKSRFIEMFGNPISNDKEWDTEPVIKACPVAHYTGKVEYINGNVWLLNLDMIESQSGNIIEKVYTDENTVGASTIRFSSDYVLYSKLRPYLNKVVMPDSSGYATSELVPLLPKNYLNKYFLTYLLRNDSFVHYMIEKSGGAKMPRASMDALKQFPIVLPPIELQNEFAEYVKLIDKSKFIVQKQIKDLQELLDSKMDEYFG